MTNTLDARPVCGVCLTFRKLRPFMYQVGPGTWMCPVCGAETRHPSVEDTSIVFRESTPEERKARADAEMEAYNRKPRVFHRGPVELGGGSKSGRKRKKPTNSVRPYQFDRTFGET